MKLELPTAFAKKNWKEVRLILGRKRFYDIQKTE